MAGKKYQNIDASPVFYLGKAVWSLVRFLFLLCMTFIILYPLVYMLSLSVRTGGDMYDMSVVWVPKHFTLENFQLIFDKLDFGTVLANTALTTAGSIVIQAFMCALTGYGFGRFTFKFKNVLFVVVLLTIIIPPQMVNLPTYLLFKDFDIFGLIRAVTGQTSGINMLDNIGTLYILALFGQGIRAGLFILIFMQYFKGMPAELEQAAMIDGCGYVKTYLRIMLPNAKGPMIICALFSMVWYWNDFYTHTTFFTNIRTVSVTLINMKQSMETVISVEAYDPYKIITIVQAACITSILPIVVIFLLAQKNFTQSIENTGIVG